ncbi:MAG: hypothetical protein K2Y16_05880 [Burkholderiales bacterium]|nr:hypothetical protein [Burkholderiales bacterium]
MNTREHNHLLICVKQRFALRDYVRTIRFVACFSSKEVNKKRRAIMRQIRWLGLAAMIFATLAMAQTLPEEVCRADS